MELLVGFVLSIVAGLACEVILRSTKGRSLLSLLGRKQDEEPAAETTAELGTQLDNRTRIEFLPTGRDVLSVAMSAQAFDHDYEEADEPEVNEMIGSFLQQVRDWGELGDIVQPADRVKAGADLTAQIRELAEYGYTVWGALGPRMVQVGSEPMQLQVSTIRVVRSGTLPPSAAEPASAADSTL